MNLSMDSLEILLVVDDSSLAGDIKTNLQDLGYEVPATANTGREAVETAQNVCPDLILTKINLEGKISGIEAAEKIRKQQYIPSIFLTGDADDSAIEKARQSNPLGFLNYPINKADFEDIINQHVHLKKINETQKFTEEFFRSFLDTLIITDKHGRIVRINKSTIELLGYTEDQLVGEHMFKIFAPGEEETVMEIFSGARAREEGIKEIRNVELKYQAASGEKIPMSFNASIIEETNGEPEKIIAGAKDIRDLQQAQNKLRTRNHQLQLLMNQIPSITWTVNRDLEITQLFGGLIDKLDIEKKKLLGDPVDDLLSQLNQESPRKMYQRVFAGETVDYEINSPKRDLLVILKPYKNEGKEIDGVLGLGIDITEQKEREEELRAANQQLQATEQKLRSEVEQRKESERRFRLMADNVEGAFWMYNEDFSELLYTNDTYEEYFGGSVEELRENPRSFLEKIHPADREKIKEGMQKLRNGEPYTVECRANPEEDYNRWLLIKGSAVLNESGEVERITGFNLDITERKKVKRERRKLAVGWETAASSLIIIDMEGNIESTNPAARDMFGYTEDEFCGKAISKIAVDKAQQEEIIGAIKTEGSWEGEVERKRKDGSTFPAFLSTSIIRDTTGESIGILGIMRDITERKKQEQALKKEKVKFQNIFNNVNDAIFVHDLTEEGLPGQFSEVNKVATEQLGYSREEFLKMTPADIDAKEQAKDVPEVMKKLVREGDIKFEMVHQAKDDTEIPVENHSHVFEMGGKKKVLTVARDISDRKRKEHDLRRSNQQLNQALEEKKTLLREVHHRVKNNMQVISGLLYLQAQKTEDENARKQLMESRQRVSAMAMVHEKLYGDDNFTQLKFEEYLLELVTSLSQFYELSESEVEFDLEVAPVDIGLGKAVYCGLILNELTTNALEHGLDSDKGKLTLRIKFVDLPDKYLLVFEDNGRGFAEDFAPREDGSLGLQLVYSLAEEQLNGSVEVTESDEGTKFKITFPRENN